MRTASGSRLLAAAGLLALSWPIGRRAAAETSVLSERTFTLEEAERLAILNNPSVLAAEQDIIIAQQRVREAQFQFLPDLGVQASATRFNARYPFALAPELGSIILFPSDLDNLYSGRAYFTQSLYAGRRHINTLRLTQTALKEAQSKYESVKLDTTYTTKQVFYAVLLNQEKLQAADRRLKAAQNLLSRSLTGWERVEAEALVASLRARRSEAAHAADEAKLEFRKALNLELDTPVKVVGVLETRAVPVELNKAIVWAMELRPELQAETYKAQMDDIAVNLALGRRNPTLVFAGNYEVTGQRFPLRNNNWDLTMGVKLPFSYDFWTNIRQKRAEKRQGEIKRAEIQDRVRLEVRQAVEQLAFWESEWPAREKEFTRINNLAENAQSDGRGLPALRAQQALLETQDRYLTSLKEHIIARARLERAVGRTVKP